MPTERFQFMGSQGQQLAASLDLPEREPLGYALFAHCFTCGKDVLAAKRIAVALAAKGIAVLRFDFTGLGSSEGDFANSTFSSNVADLVRAADHLRETRKAPAILIGHSLGGAAILAAAGQIPDARAVVTIAAPSDPAHVTGLFKDSIEDIRKLGKVEVSLAGRPFPISSEFLDDIAEHNLMAHVTKLHKALLIMHAPTDDTGPGPYDFVLAGLGACTSMTMRLYAERKSLPLERVTVTLQHSKIHAEDCAECETKTGMLDQIDRVIAMEGALDAEQRKKLMEIADKCPVHRTLTSEIRIVTHAAD